MYASNLVKADSRRILKDTPLKVIFLISIGATILNYLLYLVIKLLLDYAEVGEDLANLASSRVAFLSAMTIGGAGTFACLASSIFMGGDFSFNTIRNKLISGNSRIKTYISSCITSTIITTIFWAANAALALILGFIIFGYNGGLLFASAILYLPLYIWLGVFVTFFCMLTRSRALTIVLTLIIVSILPGIMTFLTFIGETGSTINNIFIGINQYFPLTIFAEVVPTSELGFSSTTILRVVLVPIVYMALMIPLGAYIFTRTDIK